MPKDNNLTEEHKSEIIQMALSDHGKRCVVPTFHII